MLQYMFLLEEGTALALNKANDTLSAREQILKISATDNAANKYEEAFLEYERLKRTILHDYICPGASASGKYSYEFLLLSNRLRVLIPEEFRNEESKWFKEVELLRRPDEPTII